jgi:Na+-translocating ferredoxin:NAD+ oxidoreductase subunit A
MTAEFVKILEIVITASLVNNFVFTRFLGLCIFFGVSRKMETAIGMSVTFTSVMMLSTAVSWIIFEWIMVPLRLEYLKIVVFIAVVAGLVQASDTIMRKVAPALFHKLGIYLALISTNCIILAVPLISVTEKYTFVQSLALGLGSGIGFALALVIMASIRERLDLADVPRPFKGLPIAFVVAGMIALAFTGFSTLRLH